jgi:hypothetical protein
LIESGDELVDPMADDEGIGFVVDRAAGVEEVEGIGGEMMRARNDLVSYFL